MPKEKPRAATFRRLILVASVPTLAVSGVIASARWFEIAELVANFQWLVGLGTLLLAVASFLVRRRGLAAVLLVVGLFHVSFEAALWVSPDAAPSKPKHTLVVLDANVLWHNRRLEDLVAWLAASDADVVILQEVSPRLRARFSSLPFSEQRVWPEGNRWTSSTWGLAMLSNRSLKNFHAIALSPGANHVISATIETASGPITLFGAHMPRPLNGGDGVRRAAWESLPDAIAFHDQDALFGDLNVTSTSPYLSDFLEKSGLRDSRRGFGRQPTWPSSLRGIAVRIAIDHALVGDSLTVVDRRVVAIPGSDHRGLRCEIGIAGR